MKKLILLAISQILFCSILLAQTDNPGCYVFAEAADQGCLPNLTCSYTTGYTSTPFTIVCPGTYTITAWTDNTDASCAHCASCVAIYRGGQFVADVTTGGVTCSNGQRCKDRQINLTPGTYELRVTLRACNTNDIQTCCQDFPYKAKGSVISGIAHCQ